MSYIKTNCDGNKQGSTMQGSTMQGGVTHF